MKQTFAQAFPALLLFALLAAGCGTARGIDEQIHFNPSDKTIIFRDAGVQRNPPEVHVQPRTAAPSDLRVLFLPFRVTQPMDNPTVAGYTAARTFWQTWLTMRVFSNLEFSGDDTPYRRDRAVALARARGADMVVGGFVTYLYAGGTAGESQVSLQVEAHDVRSGQMVWSMSQSAMMPAPRTNDYFLVSTRTRLPSDPLHAIVQVIAGDMGSQVQDWMSGPSVESRLERLDRQTRERLLPQRDPVPSPRNIGHSADEGMTPDLEEGAF